MTVTPPSEAASKVALLSKPLPAVGVQDRGREREQSEKRGREHIQEPERPLLVRENRARSLSPVSNLSRYSHLAAEEEGAELADLRRREEGDGWERDHQRYESSISVNSTEQYYYPEYFGPEPTAGR